MNTGMVQVIHIIGAILVNYVTIVIVVPTDRPSFVVPKPIAAVLKAVIPTDHFGTPHTEGVVVTEMGTVVGVGDSTVVAVTVVSIVAVVAVAAPIVRGWLLLPTGLLLTLGLLGVLRLSLLGTFRPRLLRVLRL